MRHDTPRKRVDLSLLPPWARLLVALSTVALVTGLALAFSGPDTGPTVPTAAIAAAVLAFAIVAWRAQRR